MVEAGMVQLVKDFTRELEADEEEEEPELPRVQLIKVPEAVRCRREMDKELLILTDVEVDAFQSSLEVTTQYSNRTLNKRKHVDSELSIYYRYGPPHHIEDPLAFWVQKAQERSCPFLTIAKLALNVFAIPAMSADCERVFSESERLITDDRNCLSEGNIEAIQCQKYWIDNGIVDSELL